ncbi:ATP-binding protein [Streptomyces sp. NPDC006654]|uniref:ATP-binding protein n=1 Tax=Streptomyces sp. NPDC006654 TaxID=3156897 RepID=UPI00340F7C30
MLLSRSRDAAVPPAPMSFVEQARRRAGSRHLVMIQPAEARRIAEVRRATKAQLCLWGLTEEDTGSAVLVVSELAGNAALHGRSTMRISLVMDAEQLGIEVVDFGPRHHRALEADARERGEHGRGLLIVGHVTHWLVCYETASSHAVAACLASRAERYMRSLVPRQRPRTCGPDLLPHRTRRALHPDARLTLQPFRSPSSRQESGL